MNPCYKDAVNHFREHPGEIPDAWYSPFEHPHGCLFKFCSPDGHTMKIPNQGYIGCPLLVGRTTNMTCREYVAYTPALTEKIKSLGLPEQAADLRDEDLVALARLQQHMDETIRNERWRADHRYALWPSDNVGLGSSETESDEEQGDE